MVANQSAAIDKRMALVLAVKKTFGLQLTTHDHKKNETKSISDGPSKTITRGTSGASELEIARTPSAPATVPRKAEKFR